MSQTQQDPSQSQVAANPSVSDDPLSHLHKMSTTAGLGSADYVAVNGWAIFCAITGVVSALALMNNLLLILPLACVVGAGIALRQISQSNGTQTGRGLVLLGLLCGLCFGGFVVVRDATEGIRTRADRQVIGKLIGELGQNIKSGDFAAAYAMFTDHFHQRVSREEFDAKLKPLRENPLYGKLTGTNWNGLADFSTDEATGQRYCVANIRFEFEKNKPYEDQLVLQKINGKWLIDNLSQYFAEAPPARR